MFLKLEASYKGENSETVRGQMDQDQERIDGLTHRIQLLTEALLNLVLRRREHGAAL